MIVSDKVKNSVHLLELLGRILFGAFVFLCALITIYTIVGGLIGWFDFFSFEIIVSLVVVSIGASLMSSPRLDSDYNLIYLIKNILFYFIIFVGLLSIVIYLDILDIALFLMLSIFVIALVVECLRSRFF